MKKSVPLILLVVLVFIGGFMPISTHLERG